MRPAAGVAMALRWAVVMRGGKKPWVVDCASRIADALAGVPVAFMDIPWPNANWLNNDTINPDAKLSKLLFLNFVAFYVFNCNI